MSYLTVFKHYSQSQLLWSWEQSSEYRLYITCDFSSHNSHRHILQTSISFNPAACGCDLSIIFLNGLPQCDSWPQFLQCVINQELQHNKCRDHSLCNYTMFQHLNFHNRKVDFHIRHSCIPFYLSPADAGQRPNNLTDQYAEYILNLEIFGSADFIPKRKISSDNFRAFLQVDLLLSFEW